MTRKPWLILFGLMALILAVAVAACGDDDDDATGDDDDGGELTAEQQAAADYMDSFVGLYNSGDIEAFLDEFTEQGLRAFLEDEDTPVEELKAQAAGFLEGGDPLENIEYSDVVATADAASLTMVSTSGKALDTVQWELVKEGEAFKVDGHVDVPEEIPAGVTALPVSGVEFAYVFEGGDAEAGVSAITFSNEGEQFHQIVLFKAAADSPELDTLVNEILEADDIPPSIEGSVGEVSAPPGASDDLVFAESLESGRYVMMCFIPDQSEGEEGPPHAVLGMAAEFTIE